MVDPHYRSAEGGGARLRPRGPRAAEHRHLAFLKGGLPWTDAISMRCLGKARLRPATPAENPCDTVLERTKAACVVESRHLPNGRFFVRGYDDYDDVIRTIELFGYLFVTIADDNDDDDCDFDNLLYSRGRIYRVTNEEMEGDGSYEDGERFTLLIKADGIRRDRDEERAVEDARLLVDGPDYADAGPALPYQRKAIPDDVKMFVWRRDEGRCTRCSTNADLEFDHIIPVSMGGANTARNLQLLCGTCNRIKGGNLV